MTTPALEHLLQVQDLDTDLDRHHHRRRTLPERAQVGALVQKRSELSTALASAKVVQGGVASRQKTLERDLEATEGRIKEVNDRLYGGTVTASRDLQAMSADIASLQTRRSELEDQVLAVLDEREPHDERVTQVEADIAATDTEIERLNGIIAAAEEEIDGEIAELTERRVGLAGDVPADLLATYQKIRERLGGVGVARLKGSQCEGCFLTLPSAEVDRIHKMPEDELALCEDCGRILVH